MRRSLARIALAAACCTLGVAHGAEGEGLLGLRYLTTDDGLLVTGVTVDMGALDAGLTPGSLVTAADGAPLPADNGATRSALVGPPGTKVRLTIQDPLGGAIHDVDVERRVPPVSVLEKRTWKPEVVLDFRMAVKTKSKRKAVKAAEAMVAADFGGMVPSEAVGAALAIAWRRNPRIARAVADVLAPVAGTDERLLSRIAEVYIETGSPEAVVELLRARAALLPPDVRLADGARGDIGGHRPERHMLADALWHSDQKSEATDVARDLMRTWRIEKLAGTVGMALAPPAEPWRAQLPEVKDFTVPLLDGSQWTLSEHRGEVVVLNFWATWCGPCKQELPELVKLHTARGAEGLALLAVSVDQGDNLDPVSQMANKLGITFPVGHGPSLGAQFNVSAIPALRVIGRDGALHYSARGYSDSSIHKLSDALDRALADDGTQGAAVGWPVGPGPLEASLVSFQSEAASKAALSVDQDRVLIGISDASPGAWGHDGGMLMEPDLTAGKGAPGGRLAWSGGPVALDPGHLVVRAWDELGSERWWLGMPSPATDIVAVDDQIWVAMVSHLVVLDGSGAVLARQDSGATDLAISEDGAVHAVDGETHRVLRLSEGSLQQVSSTPAPGAKKVTGQGDLGSAEVTDLISGRFGPEGAWRVVAARKDGSVVALDSAGTPTWTLRLRATPALAATDVDGDGHDELFLAVPEYGVARVDLVLP